MAVRTAVIGASGYTGAELLRLCAAHPDLEVAYVTGDTKAGEKVGSLYPSLAATYPELVYERYEPSAVDGYDVAFLGLPHGASQAIVPDLRKRVGKVVDLAADFRLKDASLYPTWYGEEHTAPELLAEFAFGIPELFPDEVAGADLVAAAGCYVTAAALPLAPLVRAGLIETTGIVVDAASGVSGAGRALKDSSHFGTVDENFNAYGLLTHRHTPEIEQAIGAQVLFTPHLAPMTRGILATCYARPTGTTSTAQLIEVLTDFYADSPFVWVSDVSPSTKATLGSNAAHLSARYDERTGWVMVLGALDNLVKGASGQAVQCANLMLGLAETAGLTTTGLWP
ncbi:MAG: N-acetyl-gamma-glutamyl-phosphate reductase [Actinobacteria bacterium]|nr:N-acetyl-gamma-glutamyl-phosphate reductase [Actinomycetota bacterium]MBV9936690.1 N-acetyl-gamma-glutamyl-phosphate reductase [Actinomycetota bacterium]